MFEEWMAGHPEIRQVHTVVKIVEGEDGPGDECGQHDDLMDRRNVRDEHAEPNHAEKDRRRDQPFKTDVADGIAVGGGVVVVLMPHGLARTVDQKMMDQVAAAQEANLVAVQQAMKPVAKEFREQAGEEQGE